MFEISFYGRTNLCAVIFKCHWFDPTVTRKTPHLGLVEIRQESAYLGEDVYIVASQATQVYYISYACHTGILWRHRPHRPHRPHSLEHVDYVVMDLFCLNM